MPRQSNDRVESSCKIFVLQAQLNGAIIKDDLYGTARVHWYSVEFIVCQFDHNSIIIRMMHGFKLLKHHLGLWDGTS